MPNLEKLTKSQTMLFIDGSANGTPSWLRIGKSTIFNLALNANVVTNDYIEDEMPTDEIDHYKPSIAQELAAYRGDSAFDHVYDMFYGLPVFSEAQRDVLVIFAGNEGTAESPSFHAWKVPATIVLQAFDTVAGKITFDINFSGNIIRGTATVSNGAPTFTPAS